MKAIEKLMELLTVRDRLQIGFDILEMVLCRRVETGNTLLGAEIERRIVARELRDLDRDLKRDPPVLSD